MGNRLAGIGVGGSSILVIFILLCLTTFATLSLTTANADRNLTERTAAATKEYYEADAQAEAMLAQIDALLVQARQGASSQAIYFENCAALLERELPELYLGEISENALRVGYSVPAGEYSALTVELQVLADGPERYRLTEWRLTPVGDWEPQSQGFDLWDGGL